MKTPFTYLLIMLALLAHVQPVAAQGTAFTYQGRLNDGVNPANGTYDLRFTVFDNATGMSQQGPALTNSTIDISNGLFTVILDFGNRFPGANRWLDISVRTNGSTTFTTLSPRQELTSLPYAVRAASAGVADVAASLNASNILGTLPASQISGVLLSSQLPAGVVTNGADGLTLSGVFSGGFGNLTNLALSSGVNGANRLQFTDTKGSEELLMRAAKDMEIDVDNIVTFFVGTTYNANIGVDALIQVDRNATVTVANDLSLTADKSLAIFAPNGVGLNTASPESDLHIYSTNNPTVVRIQSTGEPGFDRIEFVSNPQGDVNEWRPAYIQSLDEGGFTGGLGFYVNGTGVANKFGGNEVMRIVNGNVGIGNTAPGNLLVVGGSGSAAYCNGTTWVNGSDRNSKEAFTAINPRTVLEKVSSLPITEWKYKTEAGGTEHLGPMAQDFHAAFGLNGADDKHIATVDEEGVALAAIQGLNQKLDETRVENTMLKRQNDLLAERLNDLAATVKELAAGK